MMLRLLQVVCLLFVYAGVNAQLGESTIARTELAKTSLGYSVLKIGGGTLPVCAFPGVCAPNDCVEYVFTGNGTWEDEANWRYGLKPPEIIRSCYVIRIKHAVGGKSVVLYPTLIMRGGKVIVEPGKKLIVPGYLTISQ